MNGILHVETLNTLFNVEKAVLPKFINMSTLTIQGTVQFIVRF